MSVRGVAGPIQRGGVYAPPLFLEDIEYLDLQDAITLGSTLSELISVQNGTFTIAPSMSFLTVTTEDLTSTVTLTSPMAFTTLIAYDLTDVVLVTSSAAFTSTCIANLQDYSSIGSFVSVLNVGIPTLIDGAETWAINMDTSAVSQFDAYGFNSYGFDGTNYWACAESGIYKIAGSTDVGEPIAAQIKTGKVGFGSAAKKALPNVWVGVSSNQTLVLKVESEQGTFYYDATAADPDMQMQRFDLGRGLRSSYYTFTLSSIDKVELESILFLPVPSARRVS